jgi:hypothetical protein
MSSFTDLTRKMQLHEARNEVKRSGSIPFCLPMHTLIGTREAGARSEPNDPIHIVHCDTAVPAFAPPSEGVGYLGELFEAMVVYRYGVVNRTGTGSGR